MNLINVLNNKQKQYKANLILNSAAEYRVKLKLLIKFPAFERCPLTTGKF